DDNAFTLVSAIAARKDRPKQVLVGYEFNPEDPGNSGAVFRTDDVTADEPTWTRLGKGTLPKRHCSRLVIDPHDPDVLYATFGGYFKDNLWRSADGGKNWAALGSQLPEAPAYDLAVHPDDPKSLILGTEVGLFVSADTGATWSPASGGPTNCAVYQLFWTAKTLVAVTHGRGIFTIDLSPVTPSSATRVAPPAASPKAIRP
ncbi:MAG: WD40/YVTN/BNR-like repeat-containing protein, partial [Gemmataceae bacterium]